MQKDADLFLRSAEFFVHNGMVMVPFRSSHVAHLLLEGLRNLIVLPHHITEQWKFDLQGMGKPDDGLIRKAGENYGIEGVSGKYDKKWYFHFRRYIPGLLLNRGVDIAKFEEWLGVCDVFYAQCERFFTNFTQALDIVLPGHYFHELLCEGKGGHVLRLLDYDLSSVGDSPIIAKPHKDKNFITIHVAEGRPGLRFEVESGVCRIPQDTALIFPGIKAEALTGGTLKALYHWVEETDFTTDEKRWSVVFFGNTITSLPPSFKER